MPPHLYYYKGVTPVSQLPNAFLNAKKKVCMSVTNRSKIKGHHYVLQ